MSAPKPGDRVRVTVVGNVVTGIGGTAVQIQEGRYVFLDLVESVEVLASPVYVNSDTTERRNTDVVRDKHGVVWVRVNGQWFNPAADIHYRGEGEDPNGGALTLLVRDGRCVG